jgi:predicted MFS family arabinose efflux permease
MVKYLVPARSASDFGYSATFLAVTLLSLVGLAAVALLVRKPPANPDDATPAPEQLVAEGSDREVDM